MLSAKEYSVSEEYSWPERYSVQDSYLVPDRLSAGEILMAGQKYRVEDDKDNRLLLVIRTYNLTACC